MSTSHLTRWSRVLVACALLLAAGLCWWGLKGARILSYQGKDVAYWMFQTRSSSLDDNPGLKAMGTNAVPFLARALATRQTQFDRHAWARSAFAQSLLKKISPGYTWTHSTAEVRRAAAFSLLTMGFEARPALPELHAALTDPSLPDETRQTVVHVLGEIGPIPESLPAMLAAWPLTTNSSFWPCRHDLIMNISRLSKYDPEHCLPIFLTELNSANQDLRQVAAWGASGLGPLAHEAAPALQQMLAGTNAYSQFTAAVALGRVTNALPATLPRLRALAHGANGQAAAGAALTLWRWGEPVDECLTVLTNLLTAKKAKGQAADYLGVIGSKAKSALPALLAASQQDIGAWVDRYDRARCALAVMKIGGSNDTAIHELEAALAYSPSSWVRYAVARDLGKQGALAAPLLPALRRNLKDSDREARHSAAEAIANIEAAIRAERGKTRK